MGSICDVFGLANELSNKIRPITPKGVSKMPFGPFINELEACKAFAAFENREEPPARFLASLHQSVKLVAKLGNFYGKEAVADFLVKIGGCDEPSKPLSHVTVLAQTTSEHGSVRQICCSFYIHKPDHIQTETYIRLEDGWVRHISMYSVWLDPQFPFPERVQETSSRLRSAGILMAPLLTA